MKNEDIIGLYLNLKTCQKYKSGIFDYSSNENNNINIFLRQEISHTIYFSQTKKGIIKAYYNKPDEEEKLLILVYPKKNKIKRDIPKKNKFPYTRIDEENLNKLNNCIWYVINSINSKDIKIINNNEEYYLSEGDILKFGKVRYIVKEIFIKRKNKENINEKKNKDIRVFK